MDQDNYKYVYQQRKEMLDFVPESCRKILEVGCGDGSFSMQLKERIGAEIWGIEWHQESADIAAKSLDNVICGDFLELIDSNEIPSEFFECIVLNDTLEHFPYHDKVLLKIKKLLTPNGYVVTSLPNFRNVGNLWEIMINKDFNYKPSGILDYSHFRFFTMKSIINLFEETGYNVIKCQGINPTKSIKVKIFNLLAFNFFSDIFYMHIATLARLK
ncbi:MAG: class I SAM-dependent methyltransferase [Bacteroidales bacterium]|jgi:2-polyprenyl-3-methyl-5-hydroxy-6-metoxy-1,4-benzoquinol methylase|nr:class I SAM-dependent methyltransferase [Bacteroidales bacterium]